MEEVKIQNLSFTYPESTNKTLDCIDISVKQGEFIALCGASGSGKSTLLRLLKPSVSPHGEVSGSIIIDGIDSNELSQRAQAEQIGFVNQSVDNQLVTDKVWHELAFGLESLGLDQQAIRRRVAETAAFFGIEEYFEKNVGELSGGQKQILNLASVMIMHPKLLLLDEPTSQLDPIAAGGFISLVRKINLELGTTVIIAEHRLEEILPICNRMIVIESGNIAADDAPIEAAKTLKDNNSSVLGELPAAMRIWFASDKDNSRCPITVAHGREWLRNFKNRYALRSVYPETQKEPCESVINLNDVWFRYSKDSPDILRGLNLSVGIGETLALTGGNGSGKTTLFSVICGLNRAYKGNVVVKHSCALLPQNPLLILNGKTVNDSLSDVFSAKRNQLSESQKSALNAVSRICYLEKLLDRNPYDLSGGEQQLAAIAKLLLLRPKILLLDEPTKGLDARCKFRLSAIIKKLNQNGTAVVIVSHDLEFCASVAHCCAMMFRGEITSIGTPREFFGSNNFYVTAARRISSEITDVAVTADEVIYCCNGEKPSDDIVDINYTSDSAKEINNTENNEKKRKLSILQFILAVIGSAGLVFAILWNTDIIKITIKGDFSLFIKFGTLAFPLVLLMIAFASKSRGKTHEPTDFIKRRKTSKRAVIASIVILAAIPLTIFIGYKLLQDQKYLFISLLVLFECMVPFFLVFEGRKPQPRELVIIAVLCAIAIAGRLAFFALPQIKPLVAIVVIAGIALGAESGFLVGAFSMLVSNIYYGQGAWTPWQMFAAGIIGFIAGVVFQKDVFPKSRGVVCIFGFISTLIIYGGIMNFASILLVHAPINRETLIAYYAQGLPLDIIHAFSTLCVLFFASQPMLEKLQRIKTKYGLI